MAPLGLVLIYWASRLWGLLSLPLFMDEGIYIRRAFHVAAGDWGFEVSDGAILVPRLLALGVNAMAQSVPAMTYAGRFIGVVFGMVALQFIMLIARRLFSPSAAVLAGAVYVLLPITLFYDRMAMSDGPLLTFLAVAIWLSLAVADARHVWPSALALGVCVGLASLTKVSGALYFAVPVMGILLARDWREALHRWPAWLLTLAVGAAIFVPIYLYGAGQYQIGAKSILTVEPDELAGQVVTNLQKWFDWTTAYLPGLLSLVALLAVAAAMRRGRRGLALAAGVLGPMLFFIVASRVWYPRYFLMSMAPLAVLIGALAGDAAARVSHWRSARGMLTLAAATIIVGPALWFDALIIADPPAAPWPAIERWQYVADWPSGYGAADAAAWLWATAEASPDGIQVVRSDKSGPMLEIIDLHFRSNPRVLLVAFDLRGENTPRRLENLKRANPTYVLVDPPREGFEFDRRFPDKQKVAEFPKPGGQSAVKIYEW